ncbi:Sds3-like-domain-containing protein [Gaertneriomyces semiglobifer]|nr:Sds3-like-domain-containing protein [Gaertneriomyces semiglobifer]
MSNRQLPSDTPIPNHKEGGTNHQPDTSYSTYTDPNQYIRTAELPNSSASADGSAASKPPTPSSTSETRPLAGHKRSSQGAIKSRSETPESTTVRQAPKTRRTRNREREEARRKEAEASATPVPPEPEQQEPPLSRKELKQKDYVDRLDKMHRDFLQNRNRIYGDRIRILREDLRDVLQGTHPEFEVEIRRYAIERERIIQQAELFMEYRVECARAMQEHEHILTMEEYQKDRESLRTKMLAVMEERRRKLREEKESFDESIDYDTLQEEKPSAARKQTRSHAAKNDERREKRRKLQGLPPLLLVAPEEQALNDLQFIRRMGRQPPQAKSQSTSKSRK